MNLSREWLNEFVKVTASEKEFAEAMTLSGSKVETTADLGAEIKNVFSLWSATPTPTICGSASSTWVRTSRCRSSPAHGISTPATWCRWPRTTPGSLVGSISLGATSVGSSPRACSALSPSWGWTSGISPTPPLFPPLFWGTITPLTRPSPPSLPTSSRETKFTARWCAPELAPSPLPKTASGAVD